MTNELIKTTEPTLAPAQLNQLHGDLKRFFSLCDELDDNDLLYDEKVLARYRAEAEALPALRARWAAVDRPASADFIAAEIAKLAIAFPNSSGADPDLFAEIVADDVQAYRPSYYALATATGNYRRKYRFFGISDLFAELDRTERHAKRLRYLFTEYPVVERIKELEAELPRRRARTREEKRRRKAARAIWEHLAKKGREHEYNLFRNYMPSTLNDD